MITTQSNAAPEPIELHLVKPYDAQRISNLLHQILTQWEQGRTVANGAAGGQVASCTDKANEAIGKAMIEFIAGVANDTLQESYGPLRGIFFNQGVDAGRDAERKKLGEILKMQKVAPLFDSDALVKSIGEELRKAYETGANTGKANPPPRVTSARQTVQRNRDGGIAATVVNYQYEDAEGVQPPPL